MSGAGGAGKSAGPGPGSRSGADRGTGNRVVGAAVFLVAAAYTWTARSYTAPFGDVLGPAMFPTLVGVTAMLLSGLIALFPGGGTSWPERHRVLRQVAATLVLVAYAFVLQPLGFPLATALLIAAVAWLMGGPALGSALLGALAAPALWFLFDRVLGLPLDFLGSWFG